MKYLLLITIAVIIAATVAANSGAGTKLFQFVHLIPGKDKTAHFLLYGALGLFASHYLGRSGKRPLKTSLFWILLIAILIIAEELSQAFMVNRSLSIADLMASLSGFFIGTAIAFCLASHRSS